MDRSAFEARPSADGSLFLDAGPSWRSNRTYRLPGLWIRPRRGPGPQDGDMPHMNGLFYSSRPRAWLDNMRPSRARGGTARTLTAAELGLELNRMASMRGLDALNELRDEARELAPRIGAEDESAAFDDLVGVLQGTRDAAHAGAAARGGQPHDVRRVELFDVLQSALLVEVFPPRAEQPRSFPALSFIEAYFSNWIEGGGFKRRENRAGGTTFVHPDLVPGTLREGFRYLEALPRGLARAIFFQFLISEVHPFADGNGRIARVLMNAELSGHGQQRIVIPLVYRDNYLQSLRALSRNRDPAPLMRVLDFGQRYGAAIPWHDLRAAEQALEETNAFVTPEEASETGARLTLPRDVLPGS